MAQTLNILIIGGIERTVFNARTLQSHQQMGWNDQWTHQFDSSIDGIVRDAVESLLDLFPEIYKMSTFTAICFDKQLCSN